MKLQINIHAYSTETKITVKSTEEIYYKQTARQLNS